VFQRLSRRDDISTVMTSAVSDLHPSIRIAKMDEHGLYAVPDGYVVLLQRFNGGFIVLSYAIAFVGSLCTLELLIRRTTNAGWRNKALLASAGITFGAVSTFAMHFIFNNSLSLHHPRMSIKNYPALRLAYDPGFTVLSLIVSCLAMTSAFFIMGTSLHDWVCFPAARKRRSRRRSSAYSESGKHGDEYGKWKDTHKNVLRRGTIGMGALLSKAGTVAKWSMMDIGGEDEKRNSGLSSSKGKGHWESSYEDEANAIVKHDKELAELNFRLGPSAVKQELERRVEPEITSTPVTPTTAGGGQRNSTSSMRPMASDLSLRADTHPAFYPSMRRGSIATMEHTNASEVFSPGFNFPPKEDPSTSTTHLLPTSAPPSARTIDRATSGWPETDAPLVMSQDFGRRRASLPVVQYAAARAEQPVRAPIMLSRIQSLPEADPEVGPSSRSSSVDQRNPGSPGMSIDAHLATLKVDSRDEPPTSVKRVEFKKTKPLFTAVERFLGFDVVTREEIIKIFFTGSIAGCGVAAMREFGWPILVQS